MKKSIILAAVLAMCIGCDPETPQVKDPIQMSSPQPTEQITKVSLTAEEAAMVQSGNSLTFKLFPLLQQGGKSFVFSPLSLQYALGMTANGASGKTLDQIVAALGFGDDLGKLNSLCNKLLNELPALDKDVKLQLADAILVNDKYPLLPSFKEKVESTYYAAVENMSFADPDAVAARINDWASRNTNGLIDKMLEADQINPNALAFLMNALYFKAPWVPEGAQPLFDSEFTRNDGFRPGVGCDAIEVPMMHTSRWWQYADMDDFQVLRIPYASGKFAMYILLPRGEISGFAANFPTLDWKDILSKMKTREIILSLPKFETSSSFNLNDALKALGVKDAFTDDAQFDLMFQDPEVQAFIDKVIQKARITVAEWGTEAAAVTVVAMAGNAMPADPPVYFTCDHPFAYLIAEETSGTILFAGAYTGK
jgi:serpin B